MTNPKPANPANDATPEEVSLFAEIRQNEQIAKSVVAVFETGRRFGFSQGIRQKTQDGLGAAFLLGVVVGLLTLLAFDFLTGNF